MKIKYIEGIGKVFMFWPVGSFLIGYIGAATKLLNAEGFISSLIIGVTWPIIFSRWAAGKFEKDDEQLDDAS